jgi:hypothetical protein
MPDPREHNRQRGAVEELMGRIPGFHGYLERAFRRESDALLRQHLASRLELAKQNLDTTARTLADSAQIDSLPQIDRVRAKLDRVIGRLRGAMRGYSGVFDLVRIDEATLDSVYSFDMALCEKIETAVTRSDSGGSSPAPTAADLAGMSAQVDEIEQACDKRDEILKGLV